MDEAFKFALSPRRHFCLGARLEPLTVGHILLLQRLQNPFFSDEGVSVVDLFQAVFVCSQSHEQAEQNMRRWWTPILLHCWGRRHRKSDFKAEFAKFQKYLGESMAVAKVKRDANSQSFSCGSPWAMRIAVALMSELHWPEEKALNCPLVKANALLACLREMRGEVRLWTEREHSFLAWAKAQEAAKERN